MPRLRRLERQGDIRVSLNWRGSCSDWIRRSAGWTTQSGSPHSRVPALRASMSTWAGADLEGKIDRHDSHRAGTGSKPALAGHPLEGHRISALRDRGVGGASRGVLEVGGDHPGSGDVRRT
jgi:hypothetical protein